MTDEVKGAHAMLQAPFYNAALVSAAFDACQAKGNVGLWPACEKLPLWRLWVICGHFGATLGRLGPRLGDLGTLRGSFGDLTVPEDRFS